MSVPTTTIKTFLFWAGLMKPTIGSNYYNKKRLCTQKELLGLQNMRVKNSFRISNVPMYLGTHNIRWNVCRIYYPVNGAVKRFDIFSTIFDSLSDASPIVQLLKLVVKISHIVNLGFVFPASHK